MGDGYNQFAGFHNHPDRQTEVKEVSMFISNAEKQELFDRIRTLELHVHELVDAIGKLKAPYGRCKDGTPKSKPGPKGAKQ